MYYTAWLGDRTRFYGSAGHNNRFTFKIGEPYCRLVLCGLIVSGWNKGIEGMRVGGGRILTAASDRVYGCGGVDTKLPRDTTLLLDVGQVAIK